MCHGTDGASGGQRQKPCRCQLSGTEFGDQSAEVEVDQGGADKADGIAHGVRGAADIKIL